MGTVAILSSSALHPTTNMKFLVLAACLAVSSAQGFYGLQSHPNGAVTPVDGPAVAAARADHLATKFGAGLGYAGYAPGYAAGYGYAGYGAGYGYASLGYAAPVATGYAGYGAGYGYAAAAPVVATGYAGYAPAYAGAYGYAGPLNLNTQLIAHPNGAVVPLDEPAVAAARAAHLDTQAAEYAASAPVIAAAPAVAAVPAVATVPAVAAAPVAAVGYGYAGPLNLNTQLVAHPNGAVVPLDEPAAAAGPVAYGAGYAPYAGLVAHPNGAVVPVDEP